MRFKALLLASIFLLVSILPVSGRASRSYGSHSYSPRSSPSYHRQVGKATTSHPSFKSGSHHRSTYSKRTTRGSDGKIKRNKAARDAFMHSHPCPSTGKKLGACPGYVVDHVKPLKRGGADTPSNMQWQTKEAAKAKDKWE
jgi:hypothetical protein